MKGKILYAFLIVGISELIAIAGDLQVLEWVAKPLIMVVLLFYYLNEVGRRGQKFSIVVIVAIAFSWIGDIALMMYPQLEYMFLVGLGSFLMAHIAYIISYKQHRSEESDEVLKGVQKFRYAFPVVLAGTGLIVILYPHLSEMKIPVVIYALVLMIMVLEALFRYGRTQSISFWYVFGGAILFMISDAAIAINNFIGAFYLSGLIIMSTYMMAQLFIIRGLIMHDPK